MKVLSGPCWREPDTKKTSARLAGIRRPEGTTNFTEALGRRQGLRKVVRSVLCRRNGNAEPPAAALRSRPFDAAAFWAALLWVNGWGGLG